MRHGPSSSRLLPCATSGNFKLHDASGAPRSYPASEENLVTVLSAYGTHLSSLKQLARIHEDEFDVELDVIFYVTASFDVSSKRIIDDIPKLFETIFALHFGQDWRRIWPRIPNWLGMGKWRLARGTSRMNPISNRGGMISADITKF